MTEPPLAADVGPYLDRIDRLTAENARLRGLFGYMLAVCRSLDGLIENDAVSGDWYDKTVAPLAQQLTAELAPPD